MNSRVLLAHRARRIFLWLHLWLGLGLGLWFSLIGISGSVLAWRAELGAWEINQRFPIATPAPGAKMLGLDAATAKLRTLRTARPNLKLREISAIAPPQNANDSYKFVVGRDRKKAVTLVLDSYSGAFIGQAAPRSGQVFAIQNFHQRLIAGMRGYVFNGLLTMMGIPLLLSGLWLWWPKNSQQLRARLTLKRGVAMHRRLYDLHNVLGIYLYGVLLVTTVTGALLVKNHLQRDGSAQVIAELKAGETLPSQSGEAGERNSSAGARNRGVEDSRGVKKTPGIVPNGARLSNDELLDKARVAADGAAITRVSLPVETDDLFVANYAVAAGFNTARTLNLDPYNGTVLPLKAPEIGANNVIRSLHLGDFGGVSIKIIYTMTGLMPPGLFVTGFWLWARKKLKAKKRVRVATAAPVRETITF